MSMTVALMTMPLAVRRGLSHLFRALGWEPTANLLKISGEKRPHELFRMHARRNALIQVRESRQREPLERGAPQRVGPG